MLTEAYGGGGVKSGVADLRFGHSACEKMIIMTTDKGPVRPGGAGPGYSLLPPGTGPAAHWACTGAQVKSQVEVR